MSGREDIMRNKTVMKLSIILAMGLIAACKTSKLSRIKKVIVELPSIKKEDVRLKTIQWFAFMNNNPKSPISWNDSTLMRDKKKLYQNVDSIQSNIVTYAGDLKIHSRFIIYTRNYTAKLMFMPQYVYRKNKKTGVRQTDIERIHESYDPIIKKFKLYLVPEDWSPYK
jgi:hypothetical protein